MQSAPPARATKRAPRAHAPGADRHHADGRCADAWAARPELGREQGVHGHLQLEQRLPVRRRDRAHHRSSRIGGEDAFCEFDGSDTKNMLELDPASGAPKGQPQSALLEASREVGEPPAARRLAQLPLVAADAEARAELPEPAAQGEQMRTCATIKSAPSCG